LIRWLRSGLVALALLLGIAPAQALAYSYGDANTEDVAETFKLIEASLNGASPDWEAAANAYKVRRSEIKSHFGDAVAATLDGNLEQKDAKLLVANYKAVLVMNLERRFSYAQKGFDDYAATKILLAKAKATFDVLSPYLSSGTAEINKAFDEALDALGNPGLFGVGKKASDPELFKAKVEFIHGKVKPSFPYKAYVKPADKDTVKETEKPEQQEQPKASAQPSPSPDAKPAEPSASQEAQPASESASPSPSASPEASSPSSEASQEAEPSDTPEASASAEAAQAEASPASASPEESPAASEPEAEPSASASASVEAEAAALPADAEHAPMERIDRTNTTVTIVVIAGVALLIGGALWLMRKKGLI